MNIPTRRVVAVFLLVLAGLTLLSIGVAGAQTEAPAPTPVPGVEQQPAAPTEDAPAAKDKDDGRVLTNNKALKGKIQPASDADNYFFFGTEGQTVTINMTRLSGNLDGHMRLYDPVYDTLLASDDDSGGNLNPRIDYVLQRSGRYKIILTSWQGNSTGNYNVVVSLTGSEADDNRLLVNNKTLNGTINPASDLDHYFFWADGGQNATIEMWTSGGSLDSYLLLYDQYGYLVTTDDDSGNGYDALISNVFLADTGFYHVVAKSFAGGSSGAYKIRRNLTPANLALNKYSTAWNWHAPWYLPEYGNDGDQGSRWAGDDGTNWWWVDLGSRLTFSQVKINWEAAYATNYFVGWSDAPNCLGVYDGFNYTASSAGWKTHNIGSRTARCVAVRMDVPVYWATNYSFWEFEVYNVVSGNMATAAGAKGMVLGVAPAADFGEESIIQLELTPSNGQE